MSSKATKIDRVADYFILKSQEEGKSDLTNKKLQKLLYYSQAWNLVLHDKKLFKEDFEAWVHGPANTRIYKKFKAFGFHPIRKDIKEGELNLGDVEMELLDAVWKVYGKYDAEYLELLTHQEDPWIMAREGVEPHQSSNNVISTDLMRHFYGQKQKAA